ncbi:hypothetical protein GCM10009741_77020 [Kribbella lupini]|uniref:Uncharacterized protein n=1 Tax=Kribbella lupini TaxID=291602 RepID=A0ABP4NH98_9ACTN
MRGGSGQSGFWELGLDEWFVRVGVSWWGDEQALVEAVDLHVGGTDDVESALLAHGVSIDDEEPGTAWVGEQVLLVARLMSTLAEAAGQRFISDGRDLLEAADDAAGDLEELVGPLVARPDDDDDLWSAGVIDAWPEADMTNAVILLRSVNVTPVMRGHLLGAWVAAQAVNLFDQGSTLVATKAAPLDRRDAIAGLDYNGELTPEHAALWSAEQDRLANHWQTHLGLRPMSDVLSILTWHTSYRNDTIERTLGLWQ